MEDAYIHENADVVDDEYDDDGIPYDLRDLPAAKLRKYNPDLDLLNPEVLAREMAETIPATRLMTAPTICLAVAYGFIEGVNVHEREIVDRAILNPDVLVYNSNYGRKVYDGYMYPLPPPKTNRGRKPKPVVAKPRKTQGDGNDMASQASIFIRSRTAPPECGWIVPDDTPVYKTKVFCTGDVQVPDAARVHLADMLQCIYVLVDTLNAILHGGRAVCKLKYMHPTLKNYKLNIRVPPGYIINLTRLRLIMLRLKAHAAGVAPETPAVRQTVCPLPTEPHPQILHALYTGQDSNLAVKFATPNAQAAEKTLRLNVYIDGSVTILGGLYTDWTRRICRFVDWVFEANYTALIVKIGEFELPQNVAMITVEESIAAFYGRRRREYYRECIEAGCTERLARFIVNVYYRHSPLDPANAVAAGQTAQVAY